MPLARSCHSSSFMNEFGWNCAFRSSSHFLALFFSFYIWNFYRLSLFCGIWLILHGLTWNTIDCRALWMHFMEKSLPLWHNSCGFYLLVSFLPFVNQFSFTLPQTGDSWKKKNSKFMLLICVKLLSQKPSLFCIINIIKKK